jgi:hypothetical protein
MTERKYCHIDDEHECDCRDDDPYCEECYEWAEDVFLNHCMHHTTCEECEFFGGDDWILRTDQT